MNWTRNWRGEVWENIHQNWDVIVIGGGITGAGILRQCVHAGLKVLLLEAYDFASGTSSRSSKLVHGGMRYLKNAQIRVTLESVREREYLLKQGRGLINRLGFLYPCLDSDRMPGWVFGVGLMIYDLMAHQWSHRSYDVEDMRLLSPLLTSNGLQGGFRFFDAQTDDARLVLRLIRESVQGGAYALNYVRVISLLKTTQGQVCGVVARDTSGETNHEVEIRARVVINATGTWADQLRRQIGKVPRLRPLRGSHLVFQASRLPITRAVSFSHPVDGRPVFILPWEGAVIYGTTDVDQGKELPIDPRISENEINYLLAGIQAVFPSHGICRDDVTATFSGIRPVVDTGKTNPSKESREHVLWDENGLLTVSGGKLTTFRIMARDALKTVRRHLGYIPFNPDTPVLDPIPDNAESTLENSHLTGTQCLRLIARYGSKATLSLCAGEQKELEPIAGTPYLWGELKHAACQEGVVHLDDLLLRRVRLGILLPRGGLDLMDHIRAYVQGDLSWDDERWEAEADAYSNLWRSSYSL